MDYAMKIVLAGVAVAACMGCAKGHASKVEGNAAMSTLASAPVSETLAFKHIDEEKVYTYKGYNSTLTVSADFPTGNSPAEVELRRWALEMALGVRARTDVVTPEDFYSKVVAVFDEEFKPEWMKRELEDGIGDGWFHNIRLKKEWENEHIVSCTYSWDAFHPGNAVSSAEINDKTVSKADGRTLGWEMFTSQKQVKALIDRELVKKYGDGADMYDFGIPWPRRPLFLKDGVRFDYGDYSIVEPHVYEETGEYPFCFIGYADLKNLLTQEARQLLGMAGKKPDARQEHRDEGYGGDETMELFLNLIQDWDKKHNLKAFNDYEDCPYAQEVDFFGQKMSGEKAAKMKQDALMKAPDYEQVSYGVNLKRLGNDMTRCEFIKRVSQGGKTNTYASYLVFKKENDFWRICEEGDLKSF